MKSGKFDRLVTLQHFTSSRDPATNELIEAWVELATVWASFRQSAGREFLQTSTSVAERKAVFGVRWRDDLSAGGNRVQYSGESWEIEEVREIGRKIGLELHCIATDIGGGA